MRSLEHRWYTWIFADSIFKRYLNSLKFSAVCKKFQTQLTSCLLVKLVYCHLFEKLCKYKSFYCIHFRISNTAYIVSMYMENNVFELPGLLKNLQWVFSVFTFRKRCLWKIVPTDILLESKTKKLLEQLKIQRTKL